MQNLVSDLLTTGYAEATAAQATFLKQYFRIVAQDGDEQVPRKASRREYIFRCVASRPFTTSVPSAQKMHVTLSNKEFRVSTALSQSFPF